VLHWPLVLGVHKPQSRHVGQHRTRSCDINEYLVVVLPVAREVHGSDANGLAGADGALIVSVRPKAR
jgi:hypothetical protein